MTEKTFLKKLGFKMLTSNVQHHIDVSNFRQIVGWAFDPKDDKPMTVEAWHNDVCVGRAVADRPRPDVGQSFADIATSPASGFMLELDLRHVPDSFATVVIKVISSRANGGVGIPVETLKLLTIAGFRHIEDVTKSSDAALVGPFPRPIMTAIGRLWPEIGTDMDSDAVQQEIVERIVMLLSKGEADKLPYLIEYIRFLRTTWQHYQFVDSYFPRVNALRPADAKDGGGRANTIEEMFSISNHLFVLNSYGVQGDFVEFGCFKGFSSSLLSFTCNFLGIRMHIFDSFSGLPDSDSTYYQKGDFCGEYEEVKRNVEMFGAPQLVSYHQGYFCDTVKPEAFPNLMALWLDVDLESSSRDVMKIAHKIDPSGAVFSHECLPEVFSGRDVVTGAGADNAIAPIVERFSQMGVPLIGRYMAGSTGGFWRRGGGIPVLSNAILFNLLKSI